MLPRQHFIFVVGSSTGSGERVFQYTRLNKWLDFIIICCDCTFILLIYLVLYDTYMNGSVRPFNVGVDEITIVILTDVVIFTDVVVFVFAQTKPVKIYLHVYSGFCDCQILYKSPYYTIFTCFQNAGICDIRFYTSNCSYFV